jgi:hypothetical protein
MVWHTHTHPLLLIHLSINMMQNVNCQIEVLSTYHWQLGIFALPLWCIIATKFILHSIFCYCESGTFAKLLIILYLSMIDSFGLLISHMHY